MLPGVCVTHNRPSDCGQIQRAPCQHRRGADQATEGRVGSGGDCEAPRYCPEFGLPRACIERGAQVVGAARAKWQPVVWGRACVISSWACSSFSQRVRLIPTMPAGILFPIAAPPRPRPAGLKTVAHQMNQKAARLTDLLRASALFQTTTTGRTEAARSLLAPAQRWLRATQQPGCVARSPIFTRPQNEPAFASGRPSAVVSPVAIAAPAKANFLPLQYVLSL